jgi:hypothetical protein
VGDLIAALLPDLWPYIAGLLALIGGAVGLYAKGRGDAKAKTALDAAERSFKAERNRTRIEDDIDQDTDLVRRAHDSGLVRGERAN